MDYDNSDIFQGILAENRIKDTEDPPGSILAETSRLIFLVDLLQFFGKTEDPNYQTSPFRHRVFAAKRSSKRRGNLPAPRFMEIAAHKKMHGGHITNILVEKGFATEEDIVTELTAHHGFPYLPLENYEINIDAVKMVTPEIAREHLLIPVDKIQNTLMIAMANPLDLKAIRDVEVSSKCSVQIFVSTLSDIKKALGHYYREDKTSPVFNNLSDILIKGITTS